MTSLSSLQVHTIIWFLTKSSAVIRDFSYLTWFLVEWGSTVDIFVLNIFLVLAMLKMEPRALLANAVHGTLLPDHQPLLGGGRVMFTGQCQAKWQTLRAEKGARQEWWGILSLVGRNRLWLLGKFPCSSLQQWGSAWQRNHDPQSHVGFWPLLLPHFPGQNPSNPPCKPQHSKKPG